MQYVLVDSIFYLYCVHALSFINRNRLVEKIVQRDYQLEEFKLCTTCLIDKSLVSMHCGVRTTLYCTLPCTVLFGAISTLLFSTLLATVAYGISTV